MSSYCLTLMAIAYLQFEGVLPNLQANVKVETPETQRTSPDTIWVGWNREQAIKAHIGFARLPPPTWKRSESEERVDVFIALSGFFMFFSTTEEGPNVIDYKTEMVSILNGGIMRRAEPQGQDANEVRTLRNDLASQGYPTRGIASALQERAARKLERERFMGKGDQGIQPRNWGDRMIVVQDPFLWQKVGWTPIPFS